MPDSASHADALEARLRALGTPERAEGAKRYLKRGLGDLGAAVPQIRREIERHAKQNPELNHTELIALANELWSRGIFELRLAAALLLDAYPTQIGPGDLPLLRRLITDSKA